MNNTIKINVQGIKAAHVSSHVMLINMSGSFKEPHWEG